MYIRKIAGSTYGYMHEVGGFTFHALHDSPRDDSGAYKSYKLDGGRGLEGLIVVPYAYYDNGKLVVSESPKPKNGASRSQELGLLLNAINPDKSIRINRDDFIKEFSTLYSEALYREARNLKIQY